MTTSSSHDAILHTAVTLQDTPLLPAILAAPLLGAVVLGLLTLLNTRKTQGPSEQWVTIIACAGPVLATLLSGTLFIQMLGQPDLVFHQTLFSWIKTSSFDLQLGLTLDRLSGLMVLMITFIGSLIHVFSSAYMHGDRGFSRYFTYLNLFLFAMLMLILSDNLVGLFMGWEGVGVCSFLLIGFWFNDPQKAAAGTKAFVVNRVGDFGFILGIFLLFQAVGAFDFIHIQEKIATISPLQLNLIALLLLIGALGKSAQIPLHVWLPDAMAGPTPVSALIHAATMVTAGVYLISRMHFLYDLTPVVGALIVTIGGLTALMAASIALVQDDIKKVLAYSTVSQLGYMFMGVGAGAYAAGIFHVFTHAFFKAALFLGAGAVIHALHHEQNLWKMGGLRPLLKVTAFAMGVSTLAIAGVPPFAGFFSKDEILWALWENHYYFFWGVGVLTAGLTAFYMFRLYILTFEGTRRSTVEVHAEPMAMKLPLILLGIGAISVGVLGLPGTLGLPNWISHWMEPVFGAHHAPDNAFLLSLGLMVVSLSAAGLGIVMAFSQFYKADVQPPADSFNPVTLVLKAKYGFDLAYSYGIVKPLMMAAQLHKEVIEPMLIDGAIVIGSKVYYVLSLIVRTLQFGNVRAYGYYMLIGMILLACFYFLLRQPGVTL
jgi:NADH-quinone oxidoreductase subunit L